MQQSIRAALGSNGFSDEDLKALTAAEKEHGPVQNWPQSRFTEVLDSVRGYAAFAMVEREKSAHVAEETPSRALPEKPPYLDRLEDYDPTDPNQYWTDPATGELWRWDGKRAGARTKNQLGQMAPAQQYPNGQPRRVMLVPHTTIDGVRVPDSEGADEAIKKGYDWFHYGYGSWIGPGGKAYRNVTPEVRRRVIAARERMVGSGNPALTTA